MENTFNQTFEKFLIFCQSVLKYNPSGEFTISLNNISNNAIETGLNKYIRIFNSSKESNIYLNNWSELYKCCRPHMIKCEKQDDFMMKFSELQFILYGSNKNAPNKIWLSVIFRNCQRISNAIHEEAVLHPEKSEQLFADPAVNYPENFTLYLYRLFSYCADQTDNEKIIQPYIQLLEDDMKLAKGETPKNSSEGDFFEAFRNFGEKAGIKLPSNVPKMTGHQFTDMLNKASNDPNSLKTLSGMFGNIDLDLSDPKKIGNVIGNVLDKIKENSNTIPTGVQEAIDAKSE